MAAKLASDLPSFDPPMLVKKEAPRQIAERPYTFNPFGTNARPPMYYKGGEAIPAYRVCDIRKILHPDDYVQFSEQMEVIGELDGEPIVYALDYVKWRVEMEE